MAVLAASLAGCGDNGTSGGDGGAAGATGGAGTTGAAGTGVTPDGGTATDGGGAGGAATGGGAGGGGAVVPPERQWHSAELISDVDPYAGSDASGAELAFDAAGNAVAVWFQDAPDPASRKIFASRFDAAGGWGAPVRVDTATDARSEYPQVAADAAGGFIAVWAQTGAAEGSIYASRLTPAGTWSAPALVENMDGSVDNPQIVVDAGGTATVIWHRLTTIDHNEIWVNRLAPGAAWGTPVMLNSDDTHTADYRPQLAVDGAGNVTAVYGLNMFDAGTIWTNRFEAATGWSAPMSLLPDGVFGDGERVAADAAGNLTFAWNQSTSARIHVWARRFEPGTGWSAPTQLDDAAAGAVSPQVAADPFGGAMVVFHAFDGVQSDVMASRFVAGAGGGGGAWTTPVVIDTATAFTSNPELAIDPAGNAIAVWQQSSIATPVDSIWANRFTPAGGWGTARLLEVDDGGPSAFPEVALDASGNAIAVWAQRVGMKWGIWAASYR